jgi:creatinine amidohydrolase
VVRSAAGAGFKRILVLNGHGGNAPGRSFLAELANAVPGLRLQWYDWWLSHSVEVVATKHGLRPSHANWLEAFPFTIVTPEMPSEPKVPPRVPGIMDSRMAREVYGDGSFGGPYRADETVMHELYTVALQDILELLKFE